MGENCASACQTKDHATFGECVRSQGQMVAYCRSAAGLDLTAQKKWDNRLDRYKQARSEGIQPATTKARDIDMAVKISDTVGSAFQA